MLDQCIYLLPELSFQGFTCQYSIFHEQGKISSIFMLITVLSLVCLFLMLHMYILLLHSVRIPSIKCTSFFPSIVLFILESDLNHSVITSYEVLRSHIRSLCRLSTNLQCSHYSRYSFDGFGKLDFGGRQYPFFAPSTNIHVSSQYLQLFSLLSPLLLRERMIISLSLHEKLLMQYLTEMRI